MVPVFSLLAGVFAVKITDCVVVGT
jgi:hypothetical protein